MRNNKRGMFEKTENDFDSVVKKKKAKKKINHIIAMLFCAAFVVFGIFLCSEKLLIVKNVEILNSETGEKIELPYTTEEIFSGLGISEGEKLYEKTAEEMELSAKYSLTYVKNLKITRKWPSTVVLNVIPEKPLYYVTIDNSMYVLSDELKVLDVTDDIELIESEKLKLLQIASVKKCVKGEKLHIDEDIEGIIINIATALEAEEALSSISMIDVRDKFSVELMYDTRYLVKLGDYKDLGNKIKMMKAIIDDKSEEIVSGTIDVTKDYGKTGTFKKFS